MLEVARLLSRVDKGQIAARLAQLAGMLLDLYRLHFSVLHAVGDPNDMGARLRRLKAPAESHLPEDRGTLAAASGRR
jgi:hypothetical protein